MLSAVRTWALVGAAALLAAAGVAVYFGRGDPCRAALEDAAEAWADLSAREAGAAAERAVAMRDAIAAGVERAGSRDAEGEALADARAALDRGAAHAERAIGLAAEAAAAVGAGARVDAAYRSTQEARAAALELLLAHARAPAPVDERARLEVEHGRLAAESEAISGAEAVVGRAHAIVGFLLEPRPDEGGPDAARTLRELTSFARREADGHDLPDPSLAACE